MSIHGGQPIPCWRQEQCAEAWDGKTHCDLGLQQCMRKPSALAEPTKTPPVTANWHQAANQMWNDLLNFGNLKVPGKKNPSILDKIMFVFFASPPRADISGVLMICLAVVLFLL